MTTVLYFHGPWCGPCKTVGPIVDEVAKKRPEVDFKKVDVSKEMAFAAQFHVQSVPTILVMKNGRVVKQAGAVTADQLDSFL